jgi:ABC-type multidrug transport system fused ATPase/permease subunit
VKTVGQRTFEPRKLNEATSSSLDAASEQQLLSGLRRILPGTTIVVISHRLSALHCVDRVIVLEARRVVENDIPAALLENSGACSRLFSAGAPPHTLVSE